MLNVQTALERLRRLAETGPVARLAAAFSEAGEELALVGGPVRDAFLGRPLHDLDFATSARPDRILDIVAPIADTHWDIGREFGTIGARISGETVEITTYRADSYDGHSRKPVVAFGDDLAGDLLRRDFTVNAMALALPQLQLIDPTGGFDDLMDGVLRTPIEPEVSFGDDPLRMLRGLRFASQLGAYLHPAAFDAVVEMRERIRDISAERVRDELHKLICTDQPRAGFELLVETGLADLILPELPALQLEHDAAHHHKDVYEHSLRVLENAIELERDAYERARETEGGARDDGRLPTEQSGDDGADARAHPAHPDPILRWGALLHDIGKPKTRAFGPGGTVTFHGHDWVGAKLARKRLQALRFDNDSIKQIARLVELHMRLYNYEGASWTDSAVRRFARDAGPLLDQLLLLIRADITTRNKRKSERLQFAIDALEQRLAELRAQEAVDAIRPDLDGDEIMRILDIGPSREVGEARNFLLELRLDEGPLGAEAATARLLQWWQERNGADERGTS